MRDIASGVAVIGMACRFPGAPTVEQFWRNLKEGRESISFFEMDELEPDLRRLARDPRYVRAGAIIEDIDLFDAAFFKMSPREATLTDPQHRLFLECAWTALESAGYGDVESRGAVIGCYAGSWESSYAARAVAHVTTPADEFQALVGGGLDYLTTLVSYKLNLTGESIALQTACSTSLVAVHHACQALLNGDIDMALAGGVSIDARQKTGYLYQEGMIFSPDGHCRPFDRSAQGTVRGYGLGIVVLKRLEDAVRDRDHIHAVIRRTAVNNDGHYKLGFTAPSGRGQADVITTAMVYADVRADSIGYVEAHGTGTPVGDPIEIEALARAFGGVPPRNCAVGSVKSNFGHLVEAAGIAGLIKTVASLEHAEIPPTLHYTAPNPQIDFASTPFFVADRPMPWPLEGPRRASVSSFGIGGTNAHAVLEAWTPPELARSPAGIELFTLSAESAEALTQVRTALADWLKIHVEASLDDVAFTLNTGRQAFRHRWACVAATKPEVLRALETAGGQPDARAGWSTARVAEPQLSRPRFRPSLPVDLTSLQELARRWSRGERIDFRPLYEGRSVRRLPLPTYPFQRKRFWLDPPAYATGPRGLGPWLGQSSSVAIDPELEERSELLLLAGESEERLRRRAATCRALAMSPTSPSLSALCTVASSQAAGKHRVAVIARSRRELTSLLEAHLHGWENGRVCRSLATTRPGPRPLLAFVFSGQGGQWWGMARELLHDEPVFRRAVEACAEVFDRWTRTPFMEVWTAPQARSRIEEMDVAQTALFALQVGLAALWRSWGIVPDGVVGHSMGEVAAAHVAGALSLEAAATIIFHRSRLLKRVAGQGRTAAVELPIEDARRAIAGYEDRLAVAGSNAPTASVLSGSPEAVEEILGQLRAKGVFCRELHVDVAAHSPQMDPLVPELEAQLAGMLPRAGNVPIYSTVVAGLIGGERLDRRYWGRNLREPFQFAATIERMTADGYARFLEIGPHPVLAHAMERTLRHHGRAGAVLPSLHRERTDRDVMLLSLGALFAAGHSVNWPPLEDPLATIAADEPPTVERTLTVHQRVRLLVAATLLLNLGDLPDDVPLVDMGMDSVTGLSLLAKIAESFGVQIQTNELLLLATVAGITRRLEGGAEVSAAEAVKIPIRTAPDPRVEMVMFPGAGGTALMLAPWASAHLVGEANVSAMQAPGHHRDRRPPIRRMGELVERFVEALVPVEHPLVLVGYSIGGVVAYAVAHALERRGIPPHAVVISHTLPPPIWRDSKFSRDPRLEEIFGRLYEAGGIDAQSRAGFLESARADFELAESFELPSTKLSALTFIISGAADELAPAQQLLGWDVLCARPFHYSAKGGHFDFLEHPSNHDLLRSIYTRACGTADPQSVRATAGRLRAGRTL